MERVVIVGATSGIGREVALIYLRLGWRVGVAGRRQQELDDFRALAPEQVETETIDVTLPDAPDRLSGLIDRLGGMDLFLLSSGVGSQNRTLEPDIELRTAQTNVDGFVRMVTAAYRYFAAHGGGHLAVISSIAGTKGLGIAPAYSATKRFQNCYIDALAQLVRMDKLDIRLTDIRPGFVATELLKDGRYPLLMRADRVAGLIVRALARRRRVVVIDWRYAVLAFFWRLIPRWLWERLSITN